MTLAAVWIDDRDDSSTLCFASDSRITPGPIDGIAKVTFFGRSDLVGVWAGDFAYASLVLNKLSGFLTASENIRSRQVDLGRVFASAIPVLRNHLASVTKAIENDDLKAPLESTQVIVGGYSILQGTFMHTSISFHLGKGRWEFSHGTFERDKLVFIGDRPERKLARTRSRSHRSRRNPNLGATGWRMEPLKVIADICVAATSPTVGGNVQFAKAYKHGETLALPTTAISEQSRLTLGGTLVEERAERKFRAAGLAVDLEIWNPDLCYFASGEVGGINATSS
jgi:hypothetical protein